MNHNIGQAITDAASRYPDRTGLICKTDNGYNSWTFSEMIIGQKPEFDQLEDACTAVRILLGGS